MTAGLLVWVLVLVACVLFVLAGLRIGGPRVHLGWLGASLAALAVLIHTWPPG